MSALLFPAQLQAVPQGLDYVRILPEIILSAFGIVVMVLDPLLNEEKSQKLLGYIGLAGTITGLLATWYMAQSPGYGPTRNAPLPRLHCGPRPLH